MPRILFALLASTLCTSVALALLDVNGVKAVREQTIDQRMEQFKQMSLPDEFARRFKVKFDLDHMRRALEAGMEYGDQIGKEVAEDMRK